MNKPYAPACDRNKEPILHILKDIFTEPGTVLEIGSGTGQHALHFAKHLPLLQWQTSELEEHLTGVKSWIDEAGVDNLLSPIPVNVDDSNWTSNHYEYIFTANTLHIMSWSSVKNFFRGINQYLQPKGHCCIYGPFNYNGSYTSTSNAKFDIWLKQRNSQSAIRHIEEVYTLAESAGLSLQNDHAMPANNRLLHWIKE